MDDANKQVEKTDEEEKKENKGQFSDDEGMMGDAHEQEDDTQSSDSQSRDK